MKFSLALCSLTGLIAVALAGVPIANDGVSPDVVLPDKYIVTYKSGVDGAKRKKHEDAITSKAKKSKKEGVVQKIDVGQLQGYVAEVPRSELDAILNSDLVASVDMDISVNASAVAASHDFDKRAPVTQANAPWGLARISHKDSGSRFPSGYYYDNTGGSTARVYVVDTGILTSHVEFEGRAVWGANFIAGSPNKDETGHGTHVAATIAGKTFGVAKKTTVVAVKVLDKNGMGTMSGVIAGLNWAVNNARSRGVAGRSVVNMSLGGFYTASVNAAVKAATDAGVTVVVSAGNSNSDSSFYSPASAPSAITVAAVEATNSRAWFSNYGSLVDIFAPGVGVLSAWHTSTTASMYLAGTSMASPHVAGLAAYFITKENLSGSVAVTQRIIAASVKNAVRDPMGGWNRVAYNALGA